MRKDIPLYVDGVKLSRRQWKAQHALFLHRRYVKRFEEHHADGNDNGVAKALRRAQHWLDRYHLLSAHDRRG